MADMRKTVNPAAATNGARRRVLKTVAAMASAGLGSACETVNNVAAKDGPVAPGTIDSRPAARRDARALTAAPAFVLLVPAASRNTEVWAYDGTVPGTALRFKQGERLNVLFNNRLPDASTVHWHGMRLPNAMDGVPGLTQQAVASGSNFHYEFALPDAGTYWYHPHLGTPEQLGRGLYGALIVEEPEPPAVDRDLVWLIDDWRLNRSAQIADNFYHPHDMRMAGRIGNTITVNGKDSFVEPVRRGERIRLRLINAANARPVALDFGDHPAWIIALDGHPLSAVSPLESGQTVLLGPGQRADLVIDMTAGSAGDTVNVVDRFSRRRAHWVAKFEYRRGGASANAAFARREPPVPLQPNPVAVPTAANRLDVNIVMAPGRRRAPAKPAFWTLNGSAHHAHGPEHPVEFTAERNQSVRIAFQNRSPMWHPMHLHGHAFRVLTRNGQPVPHTPWRDTAMVGPRQTMVVEFVADNPGDWLLHCHILEHHAGGMGTQFRVRA